MIRTFTHRINAQESYHWVSLIPDLFTFFLDYSSDVLIAFDEFLMKFKSTALIADMNVFMLFPFSGYMQLFKPIVEAVIQRYNPTCIVLQVNVNN